MSSQQSKPKFKFFQGAEADWDRLQDELDSWYRETNIAKASVVSHGHFHPGECQWHVLVVVMYYEGEPGKQRVKGSKSKIWKPRLGVRSGGPVG